MTVRELIEGLQKVKDKGTRVIVQGDGEGNDFSPLSAVEMGHYIELNEWSGARTAIEGPGFPAVVFLIPAR